MSAYCLQYIDKSAMSYAAVFKFRQGEEHSSLYSSPALSLLYYRQSLDAASIPVARIMLLSRLSRIRSSRKVSQAKSRYNGPRSSHTLRPKFSASKAQAELVPRRHGRRMGNVRISQSGCRIPSTTFTPFDSLLICMVIPRSFAGLAVLRTLLGAAEACVTVCSSGQADVGPELTCYISSARFRATTCTILQKRRAAFQVSPVPEPPLIYLLTDSSSL